MAKVVHLVITSSKFCLMTELTSRNNKLNKNYDCFSTNTIPGPFILYKIKGDNCNFIIKKKYS